jgi:hypothetical protein
VPPERAFNNRRVLEADIHRLIGKDLEEEADQPQGKFNQRGAGGFTLCETCNNNTGSWYANDYIDLVQRTYHIPIQMHPNGVASISVLCRPHNVLKQILTMFCSACGPSLATDHDRRYLLNRLSSDLPPDKRFYLSFFDPHDSIATRQSGVSHRTDLSGQFDSYSEICFPPFNSVMALKGSSPDPRLYDITWFARYRVNEEAWVPLSLASLAVATYLPGVYLSRDEREKIREARLEREGK